MSYEDTVRRLGTNAAKVVLQLWAAVERGDLPLVDFRDLAARLIVVANDHGRAAAEVTLQGYITAATGRVTVPALLPVVDDLPRLTKALETITGTTRLDTAMQLERIANAEPLEAAARAFSAGIAREPLVKGWVRGLEADACQLCRWWWREGRVWPADHPMPTHKGCVCTPIPTLAERIGHTVYTRRLERARTAAENTRKFNPTRGTAA